MADNNKNPRRTIWLSETEPLSHYDIWLSKNQHLNSDGDLVSDSGVLRDCDYIFKVWDCNNWHPIVGLNSTALNKINTVLNTDYTTIHNGNTINSSSYEEFHLPLFTKPLSSPSELFDAGTIGEAILEYVTGLEWLDIFEGEVFSDAFTDWFPTIINNGDININDFIELATTEQIGGIKADTHTLTNLAFKPVECKLYPDISAYSDFYGRLSVNVRDIQNSLNELWEEDEELLIVNGWKGITTQMLTDHQGIWVGLSGVIPENAGKFCTIKSDSTDLSGATIDWVDLSDYEIYPVLSEDDNSEDKEYVIKGGGKENTYLNWLGKWTVPEIVEYSGENLIDVNNTTHNITINTTNAEDGNVIICDSGVAKWGAVPNPIINSVDINDNSDNLELDRFTFTNSENTFIIDSESISELNYNINTWTYYNLYNFKSFEIVSAPNTREPIYMRVQDATGLTCSCNYIDAQNVLTSPTGKDILITLLFGIAKFEEISKPSTEEPEEEVTE